MIQRLVSTPWGWGGILGYSKLKVPSPDQFFIFGGIGGGRVNLDTTFLKYLAGNTQGILPV